MAGDQTRRELPVHGVPGKGSIPDRVRVDGLVAHPLALTVRDLASFAAQTEIDTFACLEGWSVPDVCWEGVRLSAILECAEPDPSARWIEASAGAFSVSLPIEMALRALLALRLGDEPLPIVHGGPVRLVVPRSACYTSVKWLDHIEVRDRPGPDTGRATALGRLAAATDAASDRRTC